MTAGVLLVLAGFALAVAGARDLLPSGSRGGEAELGAALAGGDWARIADQRLQLGRRIARAGLAERISPGSLLAAKLGGALAGVLWGMVLAPAVPGRLILFVAGGLPLAGFLAPDAWL
ncbi:MAG TPA: hypothetical protein VKA88_03755, partial [Solirubrobacterales bacterium]|nr:hypothetical protein [Solirubrobacterales bacterium]